MTIRYLHTMVRVKDLEKSMAFYRLLGLEETRRPVRAIATSTLRSSVGQVHLLRGEVFSDVNIRTVERVADPYAMAELSRSNALIVLDEETELVRAGQQVRCWMLDAE